MILTSVGVGLAIWINDLTDYLIQEATTTCLNFKKKGNKGYLKKNRGKINLAKLDYKQKCTVAIPF